MSVPISIFEHLLDLSGVEYEENDIIYAVSDKAIRKELFDLGMTQEQLTSDPNFGTIIGNHVVVSFSKGKANTQTGKSFAYKRGVSINGIKIVSEPEDPSEMGIVAGFIVKPMTDDTTRSAQVAKTANLRLSKESDHTRSNAGWHYLAPKKGRERHELHAKCGDACFLRPSDEGFPVCAALDRTNDPCTVDCKGLSAARNRSRFLPKEYNERIIPELQDKFGCKSAGSKY